jgi:hypothetical protein
MTIQTFAIKVGETNVIYNLSSNDHALFLSLGAALAQIQVFETTITGFLTSLEANNSNGQEHNNTFEDTFTKYGEKTLGTLIKLFKDHIKDEATTNILEEARRGRNYLVHHLLKHYGWWLMNDNSYLEAIQEITNITRVIMQADDAIIRYVVGHQVLQSVAVRINEHTGEIEIIDRLLE